MAKIDFEKIKDPVEAEALFAQKAAQLDREINGLQVNKRLYIDPKVRAELEAKRQEYAEYREAWSAYENRAQQIWLNGGFARVQEGLALEEAELDAEIMDALQRVRVLCRDRGRLLAKRRAAHRKWGQWQNIPDEQKLIWRQDPLFMGMKVQLPSGTMDEIARQAERQVFNIAAGKLEW